MRLEINIEDERPEAQILSQMADPSGFVLDLVLHSGLGSQPASIPDYEASVDKIRQSSKLFQTREAIDAYICEIRSEW